MKTSSVAAADTAASVPFERNPISNDIDQALDKIRSSAQSLGLNTGNVAELPKNPPKSDIPTENLDVLDPPSKYVFYPIQEIHVRNLRFHDFIPLGTAQVRGDARSIAEIVTGTVIGFPGMHLTFGDYQFLMWYHRTKLMRPHSMTWTCQAEGHVQDVQDGKKKPESLENYLSLNRPSLKVDSLDTKALKDNPHLVKLKELGFQITAPTVDSIIASSEQIEQIMDDADEDDAKAMAEATRQRDALAHLNKYAVLLGTQHGKTLEDRSKWLMDWFEKYDGDHWDVMYRLSTLEPLLDHGVHSSVTATCESCGQKTEVEIPFLPASFLP